MFSDYYDDAVKRVQAALSSATEPPPAAVREILARATVEPIGLSEAATLLSIHGSARSAEKIEDVRDHVRMRFGREVPVVREVAPIYLSSYCIDACGYCNFSRHRHDTVRTRLDLEAIEREVTAVTVEGSRVVEFTLATDPEMTPLLGHAIEIAAERTRGTAGSGVMLCSDHFDEDTYRRFADHGLWAMVQWDETFDTNAYERWHSGSPHKANFVERIDNHDRALRAGLQVATGVLLGLSSVAFDVLMLIAKVRYLYAEYGVRPVTIGTPRMKPTGTRGLLAPHGADDEAYKLALLVYKLAEPGVGRWLQTRETFAANLEHALDGDCFTYRCGEVKPGGHEVNRDSLPQASGGQFRVNEVPKPLFEKGIQLAGLRVDYAWTGEIARR